MQGNLPDFQLNATARAAFVPDSALEFLPIFSRRNVRKCRYLVVFFTHRRGLALGNSLGTFRHKQDFHCRKHNFQIFDNTRMSYVHQIHSQFVVRSSIVLTINLCIPGQSSFSLQAQGEFRHFLTVLSCNLRALRTGADDAQVTLQDIYKLRQFINAASTNDFANGRDAISFSPLERRATPSFSASTRMLLNLRIPNSLPSFVKRICL